MKELYGGLDVGSRTCYMVVMDERLNILKEEKVKTTEESLIELSKDCLKGVEMNIEESELTGWIRGILRSQGVKVLVSDPKENAWISKDTQKSDKGDARKLAKQLAMGEARKHEVVYPEEENRRVFKQIVQDYDRVTREESRLKVQIKSRLRGQGVIVRGGRVYTREGRNENLKKIKNMATRESIERLYGLLDYMLKVQKASRKLMSQEARRYPEIKRLQEVPGVGLVGACRFVGYIYTPHRFSSKRKLWRYCRLGVTNRMSDGTPLGRKALDRNGNALLKDMTRKAFQGAMRTKHENLFQRTFRKSRQRTHNQNHARLATQRKIVSVLRAIWKEETHYNDLKG